MNEITRWFESIGLSPLLGGVIVGAVVVFLLTRRSDRGVKALGAAPGSVVQTRVESNAPTELSPEILSEINRLLRSGNKIGAIKVLREDTGLSLLEAKNRVEAMERSGIGQ